MPSTAFGLPPRGATCASTWWLHLELSGSGSTSSSRAPSGRLSPSALARCLRQKPRTPPSRNSAISLCPSATRQSAASRTWPPGRYCCWPSQAPLWQCSSSNHTSSRRNTKALRIPRGAVSILSQRQRATTKVLPQVPVQSHCRSL